jgi:MFS transporter, SP family, general alpha glucoside:H+ symporter
MGILLSAGVLRGCVDITGTLGYRLPFALQWIWPPLLLVGAFFAPESPWNAIRREQPELAKQSLMRLRSDTPDREAEVQATVAYIRHTTELEKAETEGASILECFKGVNLRRTEIVSTTFYVYFNC